MSENEVALSSLQLSVKTFAQGLLSPLAHDLEIVATDLRGRMEGARIVVEIPVSGLRVAGALRRGKTDPSVLKDSDRAEIERRVREIVLAGTETVRVEGRIDDDTFEGDAHLASGRTHVRAPLRRQGSSVSGSTELSLQALGIAEVKGPLGVFKVKDRVRIDFSAVLP